MLKIALTGGIASGKTSVSDEFEQLGAPVVDADIVAREVVKPGENALNTLVNHFGSSILNPDKTLNRPALRKIIFDNPDNRRQVESVLHPAIRKRSAQYSKMHEQSGAPYLIHAIPLLVETGQSSQFDRVLVVDVPLEVQISRVMRRDTISESDAVAIINTQASRDDRLKIADDVILNTGSLTELKAEVLKLHKKYIELANCIKQ